MQKARELAAGFAAKMIATGGTIKCVSGLAHTSMGSLFSRGIEQVDIPKQLLGTRDATTLEGDLRRALEVALTAKPVGAALVNLNLGTISFVGHGIPQPKAAEPAKKPEAPVPAKAASPAATPATARSDETIKINIMVELPKPKELLPKKTGFQKIAQFLSRFSFWGSLAGFVAVVINNNLTPLAMPLLDTYYTPLILLGAAIITGLAHVISRMHQEEKYTNSNALGIISYNRSVMSEGVFSALRQDLIKVRFGGGIPGNQGDSYDTFCLLISPPERKTELEAALYLHLRPYIGRSNLLWRYKGNYKGDKVVDCGFERPKRESEPGWVDRFVPLVTFKAILKNN